MALVFAAGWGALAVASAVLGGLTFLTVGWAVLALLCLAVAFWLRRPVH